MIHLIHVFSVQESDEEPELLRHRRLRAREQTLGVTLHTEEAEVLATDDELPSVPDHATGSSAGHDSHESDDPDAEGLSNASVACRAKARSKRMKAQPGPLVMRPELQHPELKNMGVYDKELDVL